MKAVTTTEFATLVGKDSGVVLVDFWAVRCEPCKILKPQLEQLSTTYTWKVSFYGVDVDEEGDLAMQFGIRSIPTVMIFVNWEMKDKIVWVQPLSIYSEKLNTYSQSAS